MPDSDVNDSDISADPGEPEFNENSDHTPIDLAGEATSVGTAEDAELDRSIKRRMTNALLGVFVALNAALIWLLAMNLPLSDGVLMALIGATATQTGTIVFYIARAVFQAKSE